MVNATPQILFDYSGKSLGGCPLPVHEFYEIDEKTGLVRTLADLLQPEVEFDTMVKVPGWSAIRLVCKRFFLWSGVELQPEAQPLFLDTSFINLDFPPADLEQYLQAESAELNLRYGASGAEVVKNICRTPIVPPVALLTISLLPWPQRGKAIAYAEWAWASAMLLKFEPMLTNNPPTAPPGSGSGGG